MLLVSVPGALRGTVATLPSTIRSLSCDGGAIVTLKGILAPATCTMHHTQLFITGALTGRWQCASPDTTRGACLGTEH